MKAPATSSSFGVSTLVLLSHATSLRGWGNNLLGHVTAHIEGTTNAFEVGEAVNGLECGVVGDLQVSLDLLQKGKGEVGQLIVGDKSERLPNRGQVGCREGLETVVVEAQGAVERLERGYLNGAAETEGQVASPDQVGQLDLYVFVVVRQSQRSGDISKLHGDGVDVAVVGNEDGVNLLDIDALERSETGVLDVDLLGLFNLGSEAERLEVGQGVPLDRVDHLELGHVDGAERSQAVEVQLAVERLEVASTDALHGLVVRGDEVAADLLDAADDDVVRGACGDGDATREGRARCDGRCVAGILDGEGGRGAAGGCRTWLAGSRRRGRSRQRRTEGAVDGSQRRKGELEQ